jgi:hypothetical protein
MFRAGLMRMRRIAGGVLAVAAATVLGADAVGPALAEEPRYVQTGCEISEAYFAYIYLIPESERGKPNARKYSVEFNPEHLIVRFARAYYRLNWQDTTVTIEYRSENSDDALLSLRNNGFSVAGRTRAIGEIRRDCWAKVKAYIQRNVHTPVHIVETVAGV